jgi:uncharacterized protein YijF (DUF1287 family)
MIRARIRSLVFSLSASVLLASLPLVANYPSTEVERKRFLQRLSDAAIERTHHTVRYDPAYVRIPYPGGNVPGDTGVCTDEIARSYRVLGIDLQKDVHEDMQANFWKVPIICAGCYSTPTPTLSIGAFQISWCALKEKVKNCRLATALRITDQATW